MTSPENLGPSDLVAISSFGFGGTNVHALLTGPGPDRAKGAHPVAELHICCKHLVVVSTQWPMRLPFSPPAALPEHLQVMWNLRVLWQNRPHLGVSATLGRGSQVERRMHQDAQCSLALLCMFQQDMWWRPARA